MRLSSYAIVFATLISLILGAISEFYSPNCRHCKAFSKTVIRLLKHVAGNESEFMGLVVEQFNCKGGPYCKKLGLKSLPSLRLYKNTELVGELQGNVAFRKVVSWLKALIVTYSTGAITDPIVPIVDMPGVEEDRPDYAPEHGPEDGLEDGAAHLTTTTTIVASPTPLPNH
jgi:hypothetical protein